MHIIKIAIMKNHSLSVQGKPISVTTIGDDDYISLTDMVRDSDDGVKLIEKWMTNKNTIEFLGIWEQINNPDFNSPEFEGIKFIKILARRLRYEQSCRFMR